MTLALVFLSPLLFRTQPVRAGASTNLTVTLTPSWSETTFDVQGAVVGKYLRLETDAWWTRGGEKRGSPPDDPGVFTFAVEWEDGSGNYKVLNSVDAPTTGQKVLWTELSEGTPTNCHYQVRVKGGVPQFYEQNVRFNIELTDKLPE